MQKGTGNIEAFVAGVLRRHGARTTHLRKNALRATFQRPPAFVDGHELVLALERKALGHHASATLVIPGSQFYKTLLEQALSTGGVVRVFTPIVEPLPATPSAPLFHLPGDSTWTPGPTTNDPHAVFNFAISYQSVVTSDDLVSIAFDAVAGRYRDPAIVDALHSVWSETLRENPGDWPLSEVADLDELLPGVLQALNERTRRKVARARRNTQRHLDQENQAIEDYYRALIAEEREVLNRVSRTSPHEAAQHEKRIRRYQLDWKRRVAEETRHHQCRVHVRLINAAVIYMPRTDVEIRASALTAPARLRFNHFLGTLDGAVCAETGAETGPWEIDADGRWISRADMRTDEDEGIGTGEEAVGEDGDALADRSENEEVSP